MFYKFDQIAILISCVTSVYVFAADEEVLEMEQRAVSLMKRGKW